MSPEKERISPIAIEDSMRRAFIDYSMSVIIGRALPDVRDGLKPVHRRILYTMNNIGLYPNKPHKKSAKVVGEVLGRFHPHGDASVYDAMVRLTQNFSLRYPMVDGQGNFGSVDGDPAAAMRYTEARMAALSSEMLKDIEKNTVNWSPNYDDSENEPDVLPSRIPHLLLNGSSGIAVGMATNIPPQNLRELAAGIKLLIDQPDVTIEELMGEIKGPDFPTGGIICGQGGILKAYRTGRGSVRIRCRAIIEDFKDNRERIRITEIPYQVNKANLLRDIARLVNAKEITGISDLRDESDKDGMRIIIELKRNENGLVILNQLYKHTNLQTTFGCNLIAIKDGRPTMMNLKEILQAWIDHRRIVIRRATQFDLDKAERRAHVLEGFKIALDHLDEVIKIIRGAKDRQEAEAQLQTNFGLSKAQSSAILEMRLYHLTALEADKIEEEYQALLLKIEDLKAILADEGKIYQIIKDETEEVANKFGDERRTSIEAVEGDFDAEDLISDEPCIITVSHRGYIKRVPTNTYRAQRRGGRGIAAMDTGEEDYVEHVFRAETHDTLMIFTSSGMLHWLKVYAIPETSRTARGKSIVNILNIDPEDKIAGMLNVREFSEENSVIMVTKKGTIKKSPLPLFKNIRKKGIIAINIREDDRLITAKVVQKEKDILISTELGQTIRFTEDRVSNTGRTASGVRGINLSSEDNVVSAEVISQDQDGTLLILCENGYGKRTRFSEFRKTGRGGKGIIAIKTTERNGKVVTATAVTEEQDLMMITSEGIMIRTPIQDISTLGRNTQGVRVIKLKGSDTLVGATPMEKEEIEDESEEGLEGSNSTSEENTSEENTSEENTSEENTSESSEE